MRHISLLILLACSLTGTAQIKISKEKNLNLSGYKTFVVQKGQVISLLKEREISEDSVFRTIQFVINNEMKFRGFAMADDSTAQLIITYVFEESYESYESSNNQKAGPLGQTPIDNPVAVDQSSRAPSISRTLIIEMEDAKTNNSLWTATCSVNRMQRDVYTTIDLTTAAALRRLPKIKKKDRKKV